ncbi:MAG: YdcF family protein [Oligoflexales bacterium]|nr:YdcF family protein [Oligoflexales bacterium]
MKQKNRWKKRAIFAVVLFLLFSLPILCRNSVMPFFGKILVRDDLPDKKMDAIILLMGSIEERPGRAAELLKKGQAPYIIFAECQDDPMTKLGYAQNESIATYDFLQKLGVPKSKLIYLTGLKSTSTFEETGTLLKYIKSNFPSAHDIVVVTSWYHTSRASWVFNKVNREGFKIYLSAATTQESNPSVWWKNEPSFLSVFNEYLKWAYYLIKYF